MHKIGRLSVQLDSRQVLLEGKNVQVGARAFDVLEMLVRAKGTLVTKDALLAHVWRGSIVEENNLQVHISTLRKIFGGDRDLIKTVPGRGYMLASEDLAAVYAETLQHENPLDAVRGNLPVLSAPFLGREVAVADIASALMHQRLVTLVGSGGIGKTRLAIAAASAIKERFPGGVYLISLAATIDRKTVIDAFTNVLGPSLDVGRESINAAFKRAEQHCLLVVDNCEHVLTDVADIVENLLRKSPFVQVLATSREALRLEEENVYSIAPLQFPEAADSEQTVLRCSAVQLFLSLARAADPTFSSDAQSIALAGTLCRRLDGIPLAIELAAARAAVLGIKTLADNLDDRFSMLAGGRRTALPRHQTLKAALDWSYALLSKHEQLMFRRLGIFAGPFLLECAIELSGEDLSDTESIDALSGLVTKSLLIRSDELTPRHYRFLETTRAYALQKLVDHGERRAAAFAHARLVCKLFHRDKNDQAGGFLKGLSDDIRASLTWAFSDDGDETAAISLATSAAEYFLSTSRVADCSEWAERGLTALAASCSGAIYPDHRMRLLAAYAASRAIIEGPDYVARDIWPEVSNAAIYLGIPKSRAGLGNQGSDHATLCATQFGMRYKQPA